jgi:hypothetical protein
MIYNFPEHKCGDTWNGIYSITIMECNSAVNLTDCDVYMQFRPKNYVASPVFLELSTENDSIKIISENSGIISVPSRILDIPVGEYSYDLQINFPTGKSKSYLSGSFKILPQTTRISSNPYSVYSSIKDQKIILSVDDDRILTIDGERLNYI